MRCETAERRISDALDGALSEGRAARLEGHLRECARCRTHRDDLVRIQRGSLGVADPRLPAQAWAELGRRLEARLSLEKAGKARPALPGSWKLAWAGAGFLALLLALGYLSLVRPRTSAGPVPLSLEDSVVQVMGEIGADPDLAGAFELEMAASIAEAARPEGEDSLVSFGDNPFLWEALTDSEVGYLNAELEKELGHGGVS